MAISVYLFRKFNLLWLLASSSYKSSQALLISVSFFGQLVQTQEGTPLQNRSLWPVTKTRSCDACRL
jgi:hypothetical protein